MSIWNKVEKFPNRHVAIALSDTVNLSEPMVVVANSTGNAVVVDENDVAITYAVVPGYIIPVLVKRVNSTNTTATSLIGVI